MLTSAKAVAFLATTKPDDAVRFYRDVLGFALVERTEFALVFDAFGTMLRVQMPPAITVAPYTAFGLEVPDITAAVKALAAKGVSGVRFPDFDQDGLGIWTAPGGAKVFWFHDPDTNLLSLSQR